MEIESLDVKAQTKTLLFYFYKCLVGLGLMNQRRYMHSTLHCWYETKKFFEKIAYFHFHKKNPLTQPVVTRMQKLAMEMSSTKKYHSKFVQLIEAIHKFKCIVPLFHMGLNQKDSQIFNSCSYPFIESVCKWKCIIKKKSRILPFNEAIPIKALNLYAHDVITCEIS